MRSLNKVNYFIPEFVVLFVTFLLIETDFYTKISFLWSFRNLENEYSFRRTRGVQYCSYYKRNVSKRECKKKQLWLNNKFVLLYMRASTS